MSSSVIADRIFREHQYELTHMIDQPRVDSGLGMFERLQQLIPHPAVESIARSEFDLGTVDQHAVDRDSEPRVRDRGAIMHGNQTHTVALVGMCPEPARTRAGTRGSDTN